MGSSSGSSSLVGAHSALDNSIRTWGWGSGLELAGAPGEGALLRISKKEMVDTQSGQVLGLDLDARLTLGPDLREGRAHSPGGVFVKRPWVWKRDSGLGLPFCCVRVWRTSVTKVLIACLVGIPCQFEDSHYIVDMVYVCMWNSHTLTHIRILIYLFVQNLNCTQQDSAGIKKSSPQTEFHNTPKRRRTALLGREGAA